MDWVFGPQSKQGEILGIRDSRGASTLIPLRDRNRIELPFRFERVDARPQWQTEDFVRARTKFIGKGE